MCNLKPTDHCEGLKRGVLVLANESIYLIKFDFKAIRSASYLLCFVTGDSNDASYALCNARLLSNNEVFDVARLRNMPVRGMSNVMQD